MPTYNNIPLNDGNTAQNVEPMTVVSQSQPVTPIISDDNKFRSVSTPDKYAKFLTTKALVFRCKTGPLEFSYDDRRLSGKETKNYLIVQVTYVGLNPVDKLIKNGYPTPTHGEIGLGREYSGIVTHVGENLDKDWKLGDEVYGIYYHPHLGVGCLKSSILIDPRLDPIILRPLHITEQEAAGSLFCLGAAFNMLDKIKNKNKLTPGSNILIIGGTSSIAMATLQLLINYYSVETKITIVTRASGAIKLQKLFPSFTSQLIFVDYDTCKNKLSEPLQEIIQNEKYVVLQGNNRVEYPYTQGKFDVTLDFIGGYDVVQNSKTLIRKGGVYLTTVGDKLANYRKDTFGAYDSASANSRRMFGSMLWSYSYIHYYFDPNAKTASSNNWITKCGDLIRNGSVRCVIDKEYNWKDTADALSYLSTQQAQGKVILKVDKF
ncbi:similar to Saccharomyces cerevisiae YER101C AST2 Protein that may have a role in targeting of plasma membrane [H+]ATPase (Pma1p) to the plasma membrane [Maudiozyma saulgeensis]|uniref:Similar to Saccharomyces cerevisiae YER101C AST2 Protein that may have a role in targeting of plasma membrane [H+]ATPase (Pma1p) to the plasma membrane n=1 Tax=Maudiozyma saulgeensis TaxID=1789683 RepID=A0A1X7QXV2_9SACH|nr:similar to Saccharomyces cerevisiae YER101C AST2 Protein that may have a role in targeting of plasma membrane [H+]ATPase (Pma1p) to the plasma membrane [Kazachstania saulgeensis]